MFYATFRGSRNGNWAWVWLKGKLVKMDKRMMWHDKGLIKSIMRANVNYMRNNGGDYVIRNQAR